MEQLDPASTSKAVKTRIENLRSALAFSLKAVGIPNAFITGLLAWRYFGEVAWALFFAFLAFFAFIPFGYVMWHLFWKAK
jgi:hypothetical protein